MACGTTTAYRSGCRCESCRAAQSDYNATYHAANREKLNADALTRRNADPERWRANYRSWRARNLARARKGFRDRYWRNPTAGRARSRAWKRRNPEKNRASSLRYHWRSRNATGQASAEQIRARIEFFGGRCSYCGGPHEQLDHAIPLSRGGTNWPANLRTSCTRCNLSKKQMTAIEFLQARAGLDVDAIVGPATFAAASWLA